MGISSEDARQLQFSGSANSYDSEEVEAFRLRVIETLQAHEASLLDRPDLDEEEMAAAQRVRHQAVELAQRMLRDVMGASGDSTSGLKSWQEAAMLQAVAEEEMAFANEEARRLTLIAAAERDAIRARYAQERKELRTELQLELQASRDAADSETESLTAAAKEEATDIVKRAVERADEIHRSKADEAHRIERRLALLQTSLADAEGRFRRLAATAANDLGTIQALVDDDAAELPASRPELYLAAIDLTDTGLAQQTADDEPVGAPGMVDKDPDVGFYQRRLAGLRDRLEKSGHPPE